MTSPALDDSQFERTFKQAFAPQLLEWFYSKIAGATHPNRDGMNRAWLLAKCAAFDVLQLVHEPDNPVDPCAVAVFHREAKVQLGYLPQRTTHELVMRVKREPGDNWLALFRAPYTAEDSTRVVGATIAILRLAAQQEV